MSRSGFELGVVGRDRRRRAGVGGGRRGRVGVVVVGAARDGERGTRRRGAPTRRPRSLAGRGGTAVRGRLEVRVAVGDQRQGAARGRPRCTAPCRCRTPRGSGWDRGCRCSRRSRGRSPRRRGRGRASASSGSRCRRGRGRGTRCGSPTARGRGPVEIAGSKPAIRSSCSSQKAISSGDSPSTTSPVA